MEEGLVTPVWEEAQADILGTIGFEKLEAAL